MMNEAGFRRALPVQSSGSAHTVGTLRHPSVIDPILSKRVCFYKSGDPQFSGLRMVINNRTFKTFDALLDSLSKKVPLPFGVRNITTPRGVHAVYTLDELEDGKSYICSDSRKVKPINLALARKKLPPWYHARPASSRRRTVQQGRMFPGKNLHMQEPVLVRAPKRLLVFCNGDPNVKHTVVLNKRTTPTFESILEYISELIQFRVVKLHTADGRRVDGLPGLILCSGTVVAAGREPFKHANYYAQKSPVPTILSTKRTGNRRLKRKRKPLSYTSKSRNFSPSSERYIVNRIQSSIAGSSCYLPSHSAELDSGRMPESVPETPDTCLGVGSEEQESLLPTDDDIEKSFRVNQDGSMTVEMKVRLTIKEEETIHWTTTLSRSSVANQLNMASLPEPEAEQEISSLKSNSLHLQSPAASIDSINRDKTQDNNDKDPPSLSNGAFSEGGNEEDDIKTQMEVVSPTRAPTPGHKQIRKKQTSVESIKSVTAEGIQEGMIGSYSYREQTENGAMTEQYCMVKQSRPVPKPRRLGSVDVNNVNSRNVSMFTSAEILQIESSGDEVTETVLHVYEQQTCQENFFANVCAQTASGIPFCRPATSETGQLSSNNDFEPQPWRPSTASESVSIWRAESMSVTSDLTSPSLRSQVTNAQQQVPKPKPQQREVNKDKRVSPKHKVMNKRVHRLMSPAKRLKENSAGTTEKSKKVKTFSSAGFIKKIYGSKSKSVKSMKLKKGPMQNKDGGDLKEPHITSALEETTSETVSYEQSVLNVDPNEVTQPRGILTRQTSMHQEKNNVNGSYDVRESMSLPAFNSSSSVTNEYVENWLEKAHLNTTAQPNEESKKLESLAQTENGTCGESENKNGLIVAERVKCLEEISKTQTLKPDLLANTERRRSVKQRIQSFENKSSSSPIEKTTVNQQGVESHTNTTKIENNSSLAQNNIQEITSLSDHNCSEIIAPTESPIKISIPEATPSHMLSMDLPSPPPPAEYTELSNTEDGVTDASSVASSPLYRLSSLSSQMSDNHPLSISPTSDKAVSPTDHTMQTTTSIQTDIPSTPREAPLQRTPSIKRAPLVSNKSFDRTMSLRKACLDKYTLCSDATSETSKPINIVGNNVLPNGNCSSGTQQPSETPQEETQQSNNRLDLKSSLSCSPSPASLTTEERISPASILSSEAPTPSGHPYKETKSEKTNFLTQKEASLPKHLKELTSSPSLERKSQTKMVSSELPHNSPKLSLHNQTQEKTTSPNIGIRRQATPDASPSTERKLYKPKLQKRLSPYSQSLDVVSPPVRHKSSGKVLSRNLSSDDASEPTNKTQRKTPSLRKRHQMPQAIKPATELDKTETCIPLMPLEADQNDEDKVTGDLLTADKEKAATQITPQPLNITNQPNMKPVLDKICYSIKSIRQITQNKRPSCLERSNSLPDFSSHVASTFGSSSKALLAFLSVMTLKEGMTNLNINELNANNVSCAEALKMIDSLREIASMEDSQKLTASLSSLQKSASKQLLQSWKGFQELSEKSKSRSTTPNDSEQEVTDEDRDEKDIDEDFIDEIMSSLDIPEELKEELASLSVKSDNDVEETVSARIIEKEEAKDNSHVSNVSTEDPVNVREDTQDDKVNVNVSSMIKKFTDIDQPKQSSTCSLTKDSKGKDSLYGQKCPKAEAFVGQILEQQQPYKTVLSEKDNRQRGHDDGDLSQEKVSMNEVVNSKKDLGQDSCTSKVEEQDNEGNQLLMHDEESIPENELTPKNESSSDEEGQNMSSATKDLEQNVTCEQSLTNSESGEQRSSEEELEVEWEEVQQERSESDGLSVPECHSEDEEEKQPSSDYYAEMNLRGRESMSSPDNQNMSLSEEPELECHGGSMGLNVSVDESTCNSDVDERSSEEEQPQVECKELKVIIEESSSGLEEEEEEHHDDLLDHREQTQTCRGLNALIEEPEEDKVSSDNEDYHTRSPVEGDLGNLIENKDSSTKKDSLIKSDSLVNTEEDSGNDHSTCDERVELELPKVEDEHINSSNEEELSYDEKEFSSEEEHVNMERYIEENCADYQEAPALATQSEDAKCEKEVEKLTHQPEEITQSVAERVILLEKQAAESQKTTESPAIRRSSQRNAPLESDVDDSPSESPTSQSVPCSRSAPQSSLSFSYDSSGVITTEPEGNRVKSIREMFLAKTTTDIQHGHGRLPSPKRSVVRAQTSTSGGYQSQTSSELSSGEDDSARKSISKGFVRRTIERLYGKKDPDDEVIERPPSAPKQKKNDHSSIFSPFHIARSKAMSEMSYFNSTNALDTLSEAARCIAFNSQVRPGDSIPIDQEQWLLRENTLIRKSASDPVGINKNFTNSPQCEEMCQDTEDTPYSLFSTKSEQEDKRSTFSRKCTYFSLPNTSGDSDACQDDLSTVSKSSVNGDSIVDTKDNSEDTKTWAERNGTLPGVGVTDFKKMDNKVHPLVEPPPDGEAVVVQPKKGQGVMSRRLQEPDMLDILYDFCGQNCPIL